MTSFSRILKLSVLATAGLVLALAASVQMPSSADSTTEVEAVVLEVVGDGLRADLTPEIGTINVVGDYALASWTVEHMGGQTLLQWSEEGWIVLDHGGGAMNADALAQYGVPRDDAAELLEY
jgi:hypothetical protein